MKQDNADRLSIAFGSAVGFAAGGFIAANAAHHFTKGGEDLKRDVAMVVGLLGAAVGSAIGAVALFPTQADRCTTPRFP